MPTNNLVRQTGVLGLLNATLGRTFGDGTASSPPDGRRGFGFAARLSFGTSVAKLGRVASRLSGLPSRFGTATPADRRFFDQERDKQPWRRWYKTARWQALRWQVLVRDLFTCQWPGCGRVCANTSELVADHRRPHRGDEALFWDDRNLETLCADCHNGPKARAEARDAG